MLNSCGHSAVRQAIRRRNLLRGYFVNSSTRRRATVRTWIRHSSRLSEGSPVTADLVREVADDELAKLRERLGDEVWAKGRFGEARQVFEEVALSESFPAFLTLVAQRYID